LAPTRLDGLCDHFGRRIANAKVSTLVHELGHALIAREQGARERPGKPL
jgi:hypothetical protein